MNKWREFEPDIARIAAGLTPDEMLRDDLTQEMRIHLWRAPGGRTRHWYLTSARWRAIDFMRRTAIDCPEGDLDRQVILYGVLGDIDPQVMRFIPLEWHELLVPRPVHLIPDVFALSAEVNEVITQLTRRQQQITYAIAQGFTQREIAQTLDLSRRTIATELVRIRAAFKDTRES